MLLRFIQAIGLDWDLVNSSTYLWTFTTISTSIFELEREKPGEAWVPGSKKEDTYEDHLSLASYLIPVKKPNEPEASVTLMPQNSADLAHAQ